MNIELKLLATMLYRGDFTPLVNGDIIEDHFKTDAGKILYQFIMGYRAESGNRARFPSLSITRERFKHSQAMELEDPDPGDTIEALVHETNLEKLKADARSVAYDLQALADSSTDPLADLVPLVAKLRRSTERIQRSNHTSLATGIKEVVKDYREGNIRPNGLPYPWGTLTKKTKGLHTKEFVVVAGRPKSRKTFTATHIGVNAVKTEGARLLFFSPEMPPRQVLLRCIADLCELRYTEFKDGSMDAAEEARLFEAAEQFGRLDEDDDVSYEWRLQEFMPNAVSGRVPSIDVLQSTGRDTAWLAAQIDIYKPDIVIFDSFYRQHASAGGKDKGDWKAVQALSRELKDLCMDSAIRGIGTHQLNRGAEKSVGGLDNLALADAIGQDADMIIRVITGKVNGMNQSALVLLGAREIDCPGIMINSNPSFDFSEIGEITSKKAVEALLRAEDEEEEKEEQEEAKRNGGKGKTGKTYRQAQLKRLRQQVTGVMGSDDGEDHEEVPEEDVA